MCRKNVLELNRVSWAKVNRPFAHSWKEAGELASGFQRCLFMATAFSRHRAKGSSATQLSPEFEDSSESHAGCGPQLVRVPAVEDQEQGKEWKSLTVLPWSLQNASLQPEWEWSFLHSLQTQKLLIGRCQKKSLQCNLCWYLQLCPCIIRRKIFNI